MKNRLLLCAAALVAGGALAQIQCERWQHPYTGDDAQGAKVIGYWRFNEAPAVDKEDAPQLIGTTISEDERFGRCLESFGTQTSEDKRHAALIKSGKELTPEGAFTLEMWIKPKSDLAGYGEAFLADKKYVANTDYQLTLSAPDGSGMRAMQLRLGFGDSSETFISLPAAYPSNCWTHVAVSYDAAGTARFFKDGAMLGMVAKPGRGKIVAGKHPLSIADRIGSYYHGFPGFVANVRLCRGTLEFRSMVVLCETERRAYQRMEPAALLRFKVVNMRQEPVAGSEVEFTLAGRVVKKVALQEMAAGAAQIVEVPLDTTLRPDDYQLRLCLKMARESGVEPFLSYETFDFVLTPRRAPRMPVVMWGVYSPDGIMKELPRLKEIGFTHCLGLGADYEAIFSAGEPVAPGKAAQVQKSCAMLDQALISDLGIVASLSPGSWAAKAKPELRRINKAGKSNDERVTLCALAPGMDTFCYNVGASVARAYGAYPAWQAALVHTEVRDGANICWHEYDQEACRKALGSGYPDGVTSKWGVEYAKIADFPAERVIPDDHPTLRFLKWYWREGDGWNRLNSELDRGLKSTGRRDVWSFNDPAVRVASAYGSGGNVDFISQWTYSYPDPIRIGLATDELFAMARGAAQPQQVMKMTQIIWYRSQTAPIAKSDGAATIAPSPWEDSDPDAAYPTIAPMHLREAFWTKIARPVKGIMYHGWQALVPTEGHSAYRYTHPQTQHELRRLIKEVVEPLGPALLQIGDRPGEVAYLESFASQMFARRGTFGWGNGWLGDAYQMLLWAGWQPEICYDETIMAHGLDGYRLLVAMDCDVLTAGVVERIRQFQTRGGIVVGDERLCPAIKADLVIHSYTRVKKAMEDRDALIAKARELREALGKRYTPYCDSSVRDVVPRCRTWGSTDYIFAVNDRREFGDYVGQHGLVMENGLLSESVLKVQRTAGYVYDLRAGRALSARREGDAMELPCVLGPCEGALWMITERAVTAVRVETPAEARLNSRLECVIAVVDDEGVALDAVVPLKVEIRDPSGRSCEWSGYYGAAGGKLALAIEIAANDQPGVWEIVAQELAARNTASAYVRVR